MVLVCKLLENRFGALSARVYVYRKDLLTIEVYFDPNSFFSQTLLK